MNVADTLAPLLRLLDPEETAKYDCLTPTSLDYLGNYRDGVQKLPYVIGAVGADGDTLPAVYNIISAGGSTSGGSCRSTYGNQRIHCPILHFIPPIIV